MTSSVTQPIYPLKGLRVLSLALNLPGPAALMRCQQMGASCVKLEPPAPAGMRGDAMSMHNPRAYEQMHQGVRVLVADLKTDQGQKVLHRELVKADVLLTSFRPSALLKLGLAWNTLHQRYPALSQVAIVGAAGARAEEPGHDLTYVAQNDLVQGLELPATLFADMAGSLMVSEAVLQAALIGQKSANGHYLEVALTDAAAYLALPRSWGLTQPGAVIGGGHAGYRMYACRDGRVAMAALEPHFAKSLCELAGLKWTSVAMVMDPATHQVIAKFLASRTRAELENLAKQNDIPLHTLANS